MSSEIGHILKISVFGQSHGRAIGVVMDGLPAGIRIDEEELYKFMSRRKPGTSKLSTQRKEDDRPVFLSGLVDGVTAGSPLCAIIENTDQRSGDYLNLTDLPRPSHADFTARARYGEAVDMRGSGHFSGRLTAPLCVAGGIAKQILAQRGIYVGAHLLSIENESDESFPLRPTTELFTEIAAKSIPVISDTAGERMARAVDAARMELDSVGGVIECAAIGLPAGIGSPMFDGIENRLAAALFGVPAVKGVAFGAGFEAARMRGSRHNDPFVIEGIQVRTSKNDAGGIIGGITTGMPVVLRCAMKPTPSIGQKQQTVSLSHMVPATFTIRGRHDPCVAIRAVPVIEAVTAFTLLDILLEEKLTQESFLQKSVSGVLTRYRLGGYLAEIDEEATRDWYAKSEGWACACKHCRNFLALAKARALPPPVLALLDTLEIPPEKATHVCMTHRDDENRLWYDFSYRIAGRILRGDVTVRDEIACFYDDYPYGSPGFPEPHFDLGFSYTLPWVLEEPERDE